MNKLKKALIYLSVFLFALSAKSLDAHAAGAVLEAEDAEISATSAMEWMGVTDVVEEKASASGGKSVGYFGVVGNKVTWTYQSEAGGPAVLTFVLASGAMDMTTFSNCDMTLDGMVKFTVNGKELSYSGVVLPAGAEYDNWQDVVFEGVMLDPGENKIVLEVVDATSVPNIDCLKVEEGGESGAAAGGQGDAAGGTGVTETLRLEAEDALIEAVSSMEGSDIIEAKESASGGKSLGYFSVAGNKVTWTVESGEGGAATLSFVLASAAFDFTTFANGDMTLDEDCVTISLNGEKLSFEPFFLPAGNYENWQEVKINVDLQAGANTVMLEIVDASRTPNIDCLIVYPGHTAETGSSSGSQPGTGTEGPSGGNTGTPAAPSGGNAGTQPAGGTESSSSGSGGAAAQPVVWETAPKGILAMVRDAAVGIPAAFLLLTAACAIALALYKMLKLTTEDRAAVKAMLAREKEEKEEWKKGYKALADSEEKEIARVSRALKRKEAKAQKRAEIEKMTYGEGVRAVRNGRVAAFSRPRAGHILVLAVAAVLIGGLFGVFYRAAEDQVKTVSGTAGGSCSYVVEGFDWGPAVPKVILKLEGKMKPEHLDKAAFEVTVSYQGWIGAAEGSRAVTSMYLSDAKGNKVDKKSEYITLELEVGPELPGSSPFHYDFMTSLNDWADPYQYQVSLKPGAVLAVGGKAYSAALFTASGKRISPDTEVFNTYSGEYEGITLSYAAYEPEELKKDNIKNALIIWLHGAGEGGTDVNIDLLGNKVTALAKEGVQGYFDGNGAYVLVPQSPTMWMDNGDGAYTFDGTSRYTGSLMALIDSYVKGNKDIDTGRIIIGGCSNGGFMTMNMLFTYPDYFAASYPVCEAYTDEWITDDMLKSIAGIPIWFTHARVDQTVNPDLHTVATYQRLKDLGADVHFTYYENVVDQTGKYLGLGGGAYEYNGHWSWIYTLNNDCRTDFDGSPVLLDGKEMTIWEWLAARSK